MALNITLHNFMKHKHLDISFNRGETTLISGDSESGKTSILCAISWCLYGKLQKIYRGDTEKVYVKIEMPEMTIYRQARPGRLEIIRNGKKILSDAAQSLIDEKFHSKDIWLACSLIEQKKQCYILEANYNDRLKILSALAFDEDDPKKYKIKIEEYQTKVKDEYEKKMKDYEVERRMFVQMFNKEPYTGCNKIELTTKKAKLIEIKTKINDLKLFLVDLNKKVKEEEHKIEQINILTNELKKLRNNRLAITDIPGDPQVISIEINNLKKQFDEYEKYQIKYRSYVKLKTQLDSTPPMDHIPIDLCTEESYYTTKAQEDKYLIGKKITSELGIDYSSKAIENHIDKHQELIKQHNLYHPLISVLKELLILEKKGLSKPENIITTDQILIEKTKYSEMKKGNEILVCPHCSKTVKYSDGKLIESHIHKTTEDELKKQFEIVKNIYKTYQIQTDTLNILNKIEELKSKIPNRHLLSEYKPIISVDNSYKIVSKLEQLTVIELPIYKSNEIRIAIKNLEIRNKIKKDYSDFDATQEVAIDLDTLNNKIKEKTILYDYIIKQNKEIDKLDSMIELIDGKIKNIILNPSILVVYKKNNEDLNVLGDSLIVDELFCAENEALHKLESTKKELDILLEKLNTLNSLIKKTITLSYKLLNDTVNTISALTRPILNKIFEKSVVLDLKLFKALKGNKKKSNKNMVNLDVYFDAQKHEKRMCGGEIDRISIALLLALNNCSHSPFIIMDEVLATVSSEIAGKCIKQIKKYAHDKYVICIEHNTISGRYDRVIKL